MTEKAGSDARPERSRQLQRLSRKDSQRYPSRAPFEKPRALKKAGPRPVTGARKQAASNRKLGGTVEYDTSSQYHIGMEFFV